MQALLSEVTVAPVHSPPNHAIRIFHVTDIVMQYIKPCISARIQNIIDLHHTKAGRLAEQHQSSGLNKGQANTQGLCPTALWADLIPAQQGQLAARVFQ